MTDTLPPAWSKTSGPRGGLRGINRRKPATRQPGYPVPCHAPCDGRVAAAPAGAAKAAPIPAGVLWAIAYGGPAGRLDAVVAPHLALIEQCPPPPAVLHDAGESGGAGVDVLGHGRRPSGRDAQCCRRG